jgi:hypothetical protein
MNKNWKNITAKKLLFSFFFKNYNYEYQAPISRPSERTSKLQKKPSALERENIRHFKT